MTPRRNVGSAQEGILLIEGSKRVRNFIYSLPDEWKSSSVYITTRIDGFILYYYYAHTLVPAI